MTNPRQLLVDWGAKQYNNPEGMKNKADMSIHMAVYYLRGLQWSATTVYPQNIAVQASLRVVHQQSSQQCYNDLRSEFPNYVCWLVNPSTKLLCGISIWRFPKLGVPRKSSILKGFSNINNNFWVPPFMETSIC